MLGIPAVPLRNTGNRPLSSPVCKWPPFFLSLCQEKQKFIWIPGHKTIIVRWQLIFTGLQCTCLYRRDNASKAPQTFHTAVMFYSWSKHWFRSIMAMPDTPIPLTVSTQGLSSSFLWSFCKVQLVLVPTTTTKLSLQRYINTSGGPSGLSAKGKGCYSHLDVHPTDN